MEAVTGAQFVKILRCLVSSVVISEPASNSDSFSLAILAQPKSVVVRANTSNVAVTALTAQAAGKNVFIVGTGTCTTFPNYEDISTIQILN